MSEPDEVYQEILDRYRDEHTELTEDYHDDPDNYPGGREAFDQLHNALWVRCDGELRLAGYRPSHDPAMLAELSQAINDSVQRIESFLDREYPGWKDDPI